MRIFPDAVYKKRKRHFMNDTESDIKFVLSKSLGITTLTGPALEKAVKHRYIPLSDREKRRINRDIARHVIHPIAPGNYKKPGRSSLSNIRVLGINHAGLLDVTLEWKTGQDKALHLVSCRIDAGGDQINVSKVFSHFNEKIALVALAGKNGLTITDAWEKNFLNKHIISTLIRDAKEDAPAAIYHIIDGETLPAMFGWAEKVSRKTLKTMNRKALSIISQILKKNTRPVWLVLSAGGPIKYDRSLAYYASLIKAVKEKFQDQVEFLIDFKFVSGKEETMSVLDIPRDTPQDIIKPNVEEFVQILASSGLTKPGDLDKDTITEKTVREYAIKLREKYNLLGVLVSMDKAGLMLVLKDRIIKEKGIKIKLACPTGSGDSLKAGVLYALSNGKSFEEAVHTGNLFGAATASMEGTQTVTPKTFAITKKLAQAQNVKPVIEYLS